MPRPAACAPRRARRRRPPRCRTLLREVEEAVDVHARVGDDRAGADLFGEQIEPLRGVGPAVGHDGVVAFEHERHVPELVGERALGLRGGGVERLGRDGRAFALVRGGEQRALHLRSPRGRAVEPQARADLAERERHAQHPPALVEPVRSRAALFGEDAPREAREAEDLGVKRKAVAAALAQLALGLVAVLLGHEEHAAAAALADRSGDLFHDGGRFAAAGPADDQPQHRAHFLSHDLCP